MDHKKFGAFSNLGASSHCLNGIKAGPALVLGGSMGFDGMGLGLSAWVWVCRRGLWWVWVCRRGYGEFGWLPWDSVA